MKEIHLFFTFCMCVIVWIVHIRYYPSFANVPQNDFVSFHKKYVKKISWIVIPMMLCEVFSLILLILEEKSIVFSLLASFFLAVSWILTFVFAVPHHNELSKKFDANIHKKLMKIHKIRSIFWTISFFYCLFYF